MRLLRCARLAVLGLGIATLLGGCYVVPVRPAPPIVVRRVPAACWHPGWWGPWGWHRGYWGPCR